MAFNPKHLVQFNSGGALGEGEGSVKKLWHYVTNDVDTAVEGNGYFDNTAMNIGDIVICSLDLDNQAEPKIYVVTAGTGDPNNNDVTIGTTLGV